MDELISAQDINADPELLRALSFSKDKTTRSCVAANPNTPTDVLLKLGAEFPGQLIENPVFSLLLLENPALLEEIPLPTLQSLLKLDNVPSFILEQAADKADVEVQLALTMNPQTERKILERLTRSTHPQVVQAVGLHVNVAGELTQGYEEKAQELILKIIPSIHKVDIRSYMALTQICPIPEYIVKFWMQESSYQDFCRTIVQPATLPSILELLASHPSNFVRFKVAEHPNTPVSILRQLATEQEQPEWGSVKSALAGNPATPEDILESLARESNDITVIEKIATNPNTALNILEYLASDTSKGLVETAAKRIKELKGEYTSEVLRDKKTPSWVLEKLLKQDVQSYALSVAKHPNAPIELLLEFSKSNDSRLREAVAENTNAPATILEELAYDESGMVRCKVARNLNTPTLVLFKLLARDVAVSNTIASQLFGKDYYSIEKENIIDILAEESTSSLERIIQRLIRDCGAPAQIFLARHLDLPKQFLSQLASEDSYLVRQAVAENPNTPVEDLIYLAYDKQLQVRQAVVQNPSTPISTIEQLVQNNDINVLAYVAEKTELSSQILEKLANCEAESIRLKAMANLNLSKQAAERILCSEYAKDYLKQNPNFLSDNPKIWSTVINYYAKSSSDLVRFIALQQPQVTSELLQEKSCSINWLDRFAVAKNPQTLLSILNRLAEDSNQIVRAAARYVIKNRINK